MKMILEEDDWYNIALIFQSKANKNYFMLFQAVEDPQIQKQLQIQALPFTVLSQEN